MLGYFSAPLWLWTLAGAGLLAAAGCGPVAWTVFLVVAVPFTLDRQQAGVFLLRRTSELPPLTISVNVSAEQFIHADLVAQVGAALHETGLHPSSLKLEVTESVIMGPTSNAASTVASLKAMGD